VVLKFFGAKRGDAVVALVLLICYLLFVISIIRVDAAPDGPDSITLQSNETRAAISAGTLNISGGYIATINISASSQNPHWKGLVGQVTGSFTLDDAGGSTLYDWSLSTIGGEVYATRNSSTVSWSSMRCANKTVLENENTALSHTNPNDNITRTFNGTTHAEFFVGNVNISVNSCANGTLNTYVGNASQDTDFEEITLTDGTLNNGKVVYAAILETNVAGFDSNTYDFQMIVPEVGSQGNTAWTAYYLYVELS
jgi:hypothetical protein